MNSACWLTIGLLLALAASCVLSDEPDEELERELEREREILKQVKPEERGMLQLARLFDFGYYKAIFRKDYGENPAEEQNRRTLFTSRAVQVFVSCFKYQYAGRHSFDSLNRFSDHTLSELESMNLWHRPESSNLEANSDDPDAPLPEFLPHKHEDVEGEVRKLAEQHANEPGYEELLWALNAHDENQATGRRNKHDTNSTDEELKQQQQRPARLLPQLINTPLHPSETSNRIADKWSVPSNNPHYEPIELHSFGLFSWKKKQTKVKIVDSGYEPDGEHVGLQLRIALSQPLSAEEVQEVNRGVEMDDVYSIDHRRNCMFQPRNQGSCGACYAFATIAVMEWIYCKSTLDLMAFSEQYMIDCGRRAEGEPHARLNGCDGGGSVASVHFIRNFGVELADNYRFTGHEGTCPYEENYDIKKMGYFRFEFSHLLFVKLDKLEMALVHQPLLIKLRTPSSWHQYGGGIHYGEGCNPRGSHSVVLVGEGRENGVEFWLIRNSHSTEWGEGGYFRLAKVATKICFGEQAYAIGMNAVHNRADPKIKQTVKKDREVRVF